ncbi:MAG: guanylate kinase [Christensenellaceae bacterium]|jgi:guanylate kinase|nr:guanylate kinase [Christensenellaceae bacterium]
MQRKGILFIVSGPSGAGKGTVLNQVMRDLSGLSLSISVTTREPRDGEIDGVHYHFRKNEEFDEMVKNNEFLEHVSKYKNRYGTPRTGVEELLDAGRDVILEIETKGAIRIKSIFRDAVLVFITPYSSDELETRLDSRGSENSNSKELRLKIAKDEYKKMKHYDFIALNDDINVCVETIKAIIIAERSRLTRNTNAIERYIPSK